MKGEKHPDSEDLTPGRETQEEKEAEDEEGDGQLEEEEEEEDEEDKEEEEEEEEGPLEEEGGEGQLEEEEGPLEEEEGEEKGGAGLDEVAARFQEELTGEPQQITRPVSSLQGRPLTGSSSLTSENSPTAHSLQAESPSTASSYDYDLELSSSDEKLLTSLQEKTDQEPPEKPGPEGAAEPAAKEEWKQEKRVDYTASEKESRTRLRRESLVSISSKDILFEKEDQVSVYPLTMTWKYGWNSSLPVYYIRDEKQRVLLYASAHTAVIYNVFKNDQHHLMGHPNVISCMCVSEDRRWIATADKGPSCLLIMWDSYTG